MAGRLVYPIFKAFDSGANLLVGGKLYTYEPGTTTAKTTYSNAAGTVAHTNPVILDSLGEKEIFVSGPTKLILKDADDVTIWTKDSAYGIGGDVVTAQTIAALRLMTGETGASVQTLGYYTAGDGGGGPVRVLLTAPGGGLTDNGGSIIKPGGVVGDAIAAGSSYWGWEWSGPPDVKWFGAKGDGITDDLAAFNAAYTYGAATTQSMYVSGLAPGKYYKLTNALNITQQSFVLYGDGVGSLICAYNSSGYNAITIKATHVTVRNLAITGTASSGHGIQLGLVGTSAHYASISDVSINWMGGNDLEIVEAISSVYSRVIMDHDSGYRPATLIGASEGARNHGVNIHKSATGINNDQKFIGCTLNSANKDTGSELRIGVDGSGTFWMFEWVGGLIQGQTVNGKLIEISNASYLHFQAGDYEPNAGVTGNLSITSASYVTFAEALIQGDVTFTGSNNCSIRDSSINAITISANCKDITVDNTVYGSTSGKVIDLSGTAKLTNLTNGSNALHHAGDRMVSGSKELYFYEDMEYWLGGASPTIPHRLAAFTGTFTKETTIKRSGTNSLKLVAAAATDKAFSQINVTAGREVFVDAWVYNETTSGLARITGVNTATSADSTIVSNSIGTWEHIQVTFTPAETCNTFQLDFGVGGAGTVYWDDIKIYTRAVVDTIGKTLSSSATPHLCPESRNIKSFITGDTTTITGFTYPLVGEQFSILFAHAKTLTHSATLVLDGGVNFVGKDKDIITLMYFPDGVMREISRMVY